jgi:hypothetical protein
MMLPSSETQGIIGGVSFLQEGGAHGRLDVPGRVADRGALELIEDKLQEGFDDLEAVTHTLKTAWKTSDPTSARPDPLPTLETIGALWSFVDGLRRQLEQLGRKTDELESLIGDVDSIRLDHRATKRWSQRPEDHGSNGGDGDASQLTRRPRGWTRFVPRSNLSEELEAMRRGLKQLREAGGSSPVLEEKVANVERGYRDVRARLRKVEKEESDG